MELARSDDTPSVTFDMSVGVRDAEWRIRLVDQASDGGHVLAGEGLFELVQGREGAFLSKLVPKFAFSTHVILGGLSRYRATLMPACLAPIHCYVSRRHPLRYLHRRARRIRHYSRLERYSYLPIGCVIKTASTGLWIVPLSTQHPFSSPRQRIRLPTPRLFSPMIESLATN